MWDELMDFEDFGSKKKLFLLKLRKKKMYPPLGCINVFHLYLQSFIGRPHLNRTPNVRNKIKIKLFEERNSNRFWILKF